MDINKVSEVVTVLNVRFIGIMSGLEGSISLMRRSSRTMTQRIKIYDKKLPKFQHIAFVKIRGRRSERSPSKRMFVGYSTVEPGKQTKSLRQ
jgi:hypothetical protein